MARAEFLALAMILMAFPGLSAQEASEGGADRIEIDDPPAPVGGAMIKVTNPDNLREDVGPKPHIAPPDRRS